MAEEATIDLPSGASEAPGPSAQAVLQLLAQRFPGLWGASVMPLKRGIFQELAQALGDEVPRAALKEALARHTRSTPYLRAMASGQARTDLQMCAVEPVSLEHRLGALQELYRRRTQRAAQDKGVQQQAAQSLQRGLVQALQAQPGARMDLVGLTATWPAAMQRVVDAALADYERQRARDAALLQAFAASGQSEEDFARSWGRPLAQLQAALRRRSPL
ncbi:MAG: ProQ/FINO family protein [Rhodoferax sp.]